MKRAPTRQPTEFEQALMDLLAYVARTPDAGKTMHRAARKHELAQVRAWAL